MSSKIMYNYRAFDLLIQSELPFRELLPTSPIGSDVNPIIIGFNSVSPYGLVGSLSLNTPSYQATSDELWLHIPDVARFLIMNGNQIYIDPLPKADEDSIRLFVLGSCMGALLMQRQLLLLHGNAIKIGAQCISFIGNSGSGKSTLSGAFFKRGYSILADDICVINNEGEVLPSFPQIKLWADVAKKLMINTQTLKKIRPDVDKFALPLKQQFHSKATQLRIVYLLETHHQKEISITTLTGMEKLHALQHHVYRKMYLSNQARKHLCFKQCMQLASIIEFVRIRRPIDGFTLDAIINKIKLDLMKRGFTENALTQ